MMEIILGSSSKWRKQIFKEAGYVFETMSPNIDERKITHDDPTTLSLETANAKAEALIPKIIEPSLLITTDLIITCNGHIYKKPTSKEQAKKFLNNYARFPAETISAVVITDTQSGKRVSGIDKVNVFFHQLSESVIKNLIDNKAIFSWAGGFQVDDGEGNLSSYIKQIDGTLDSVKGLPLILTSQLLREIA